MMWQKQNSHENWKDGSDEVLQQEIDACRRGLFFFKIKTEGIPAELNNSNNSNQEEKAEAAEQKMDEDKTN